MWKLAQGMSLSSKNFFAICRTQGSLGDLLWGGKATISYDQVFALAAVIVLCSALLRFAALGLTRKEGGHDPV